MPFDNIEKAQISAYLRSKGFRFTMIVDTEEELEDFIPYKGELVFIKDKLYMSVGDGVLKVSLCVRYYFWQLLKTLPSVNEKTQELWRRIDQTMGVGQVKDFIYPPDIMSILWSSVPSNFEAKWEGGPLPSNSPLKKEWENSIKDEGWFLRNFDSQDPRELGEHQKQKVIKHTHTAPSVMIGYSSKIVDARIWGAATWAAKYYFFANDVYTMDPAGGKFTRPAGIGVFRVQKIAEAS